jgi:hypothetical protein
MLRSSSNSTVRTGSHSDTNTLFYHSTGDRLARSAGVIRRDSPWWLCAPLLLLLPASA